MPAGWGNGTVRLLVALPGDEGPSEVGASTVCMCVCVCVCMCVCECVCVSNTCNCEKIEGMCEKGVRGARGTEGRRVYTCTCRQMSTCTCIYMYMCTGVERNSRW